MNNNFANNLKKIRKDHGLSQEQLAEELGVSRQSISKWESSMAYPEMDKIITICKKYDINIDDLLHRDITEVKREDDKTKKYNNYVNSFFKFITDSIDMFIHLNLDSKLKCIFENIFYIIVLVIGLFISNSIINTIIYKIFSVLPRKVYLIVSGVLSSLFLIVFIIIAGVILIHLFKVRYLDYYNKVKNTKENNKSDKDNIVVNTVLKEENKIIIRDKKDSSYSFLRGFVDFVVLFIRIQAFFVFLGIVGLTIFGVFCTTLSLFHITTHEIFIPITTFGISSVAMCIIVMFVLFGFIFNKAYNLNRLFLLFLISLVVCGASIAGIVMKSISIEMYDLPTVTDTKEFDFNESLKYLNNSSNSNREVNYVIDNSIKKDKIVVDVSYTEDYIKASSTVNIETNEIESYIYNFTEEDFINQYNFLMKYLKDNKIPKNSLNGYSVTIKGNEANIKTLIKNSTNKLYTKLDKTKDGYSLYYYRNYPRNIACHLEDFYYNCAAIHGERYNDIDAIAGANMQFDGTKLIYDETKFKCDKAQDRNDNYYYCTLKEGI